MRILGFPIRSRNIGLARGSGTVTVTIMHDTFSGSSSTLEGRVPDTKQVASNTWDNLSNTQGTVSVNGSGQATGTGMTTSKGLTKYNVATNNASVTWKVDALGNGNNVWLLFNHSGANDYENTWFLTVDNTTMVLWERVLGTSTQRGSFVTSFTAGDIYKVTANGDSVDCFKNGVSRISYTISNRPLKTNTVVGLGADNSNNYLMDYILVESV